MFKRYFLSLLPVILMGASAPVGCETEAPQFATTASDSGDTSLDTSSEVSEDHSVSCQPYMAVSLRECVDSALTFGLVGGVHIIGAQDIFADGSAATLSPNITYLEPENEDSPAEVRIQCTDGNNVRLTSLSCRG